VGGNLSAPRDLCFALSRAEYIVWYSNRSKTLTKDELLNGLNNILNIFLYGFVNSKLVTPEAWTEASRTTAVFRGHEYVVEIHLAPLAKRVRNPTLGFKRNYENSLLRAGCPTFDAHPLRG
jgi:hypothetical protein